MLRNNNQGIAARISRKSIRDNRLRFVVLVIVTAVFTASIMMLQSGGLYMRDAIKKMGDYEMGIYQVGAENLSQEEAKRVAQNDSIKEAGIAVYIGEPSAPSLFNRNFSIGYADDIYMRDIYAYPTKGHLPEAENEISMDTTTMDALGIQRKTGEKVLLKWKTGGKEFQTEFVVSGFWDGNKTTLNGHIWVSKAFVQKQNDKTWSVHGNLKNPYFIERTAEKIRQNTGLPQNRVYVNERYKTKNLMDLFIGGLPFWLGMLFAFLCGKLILSTVFHLSVVKDQKIYDMMKMQGMTSKQRKHILYHQAMDVALAGVSIGCILGIPLGRKIIGTFITKRWEFSVVFHFKSLVITIIFGVLMVLWAVKKPAKLAGGQIRLKKLSKEKKQKRKIQTHNRHISIPGMAWTEVRSGKKVLTVILTLAAGMGLFCTTDTIYKSCRAERFVENWTISDVILEDKSLEEGYRFYNPYSTTVSEPLIEGLDGLGTVSEMGRLYSAETDLQLSDRVYEDIISYFEENGGERLDYMKGDEIWLKSYQHMKDTKSCKAIVQGIDGLINETLEEIGMIQGNFDRKKFERGGYVISVSMGDTEAGENVANYETGDMVEFEGQMFEVMSVVNLEEEGYVLVEGNSSDEAAFSPFFLMPSRTFRTLYPDHTVKKLFVDIKNGEREKTMDFLTTYQEKENKNLYMITKEMLSKRFWQEIHLKIQILLLLCITFMISALLSFINFSTTGIWERKQVFQTMRSIGMTKREVRRMVLLENLMIAALTAIFSFLFAYLLAGVGARLYMMPQYYSEFTLSLRPLWILIPIVFLTAIWTAVAALRKTED